MAHNSKNLINTVELGRAVKRRREETGLSLRDVADKTGVSASTLSRIENGTGKPDADNIARLTEGPRTGQLLTAPAPAAGVGWP